MSTNNELASKNNSNEFNDANHLSAEEFISKDPSLVASYSAVQRAVKNPHQKIDPAQVLHLQRTIGNAAVNRLLVGDVQNSENNVSNDTVQTEQSSDFSIQRLMSLDKFKEKSRGPLWGAFTGKRDKVKDVEKALTAYHSATSKSVGLTQVIDACDSYLDLAGRAGSRIAGVTALKKAATIELAAWRLRDREPLPQSVYRMDERAPETIAKDGFQPWNPDGDVSIIEHVTQVLRTQKPDLDDGTSGDIGKGAKKHSQYVSTAGNLDFAMDPTLLAGLLNKYFYKIDTQTNPQNFNDVNKHFDDMGEPNPYETQFEWAHEGGVAPACITHYIHGRDLQDMILAGSINEEALDWKAMPALPPVPQVEGDVSDSSDD